MYITATEIKINDIDYPNYGNPSFPDVGQAGGWQHRTIRPIALDKDVYLFRPQAPGEPFSLNGSNTVTRFDLLESQGNAAR